MARSCESCGKSLEGRSPRAVTCSAKCRKAVFNARHGTVRTLPAVPEQSGSSAVAAVRAELEAAGRLDTYLGAAAVALAARVDSSTAVMGFAALVKQLQATMEAATAGVRAADDAVDELRARRDRKYAG